MSADGAKLSGSEGTTDLAGLKIGLLSSPTEVAKAAEAMLRRRYTWADADDADTLVALGGDGFMLQTLHHMLDKGCPKPVFGMNRGTVGFLMNEWRLDRLAERIAGAKAIRVAPLQMDATTVSGESASHRRDQRSLAASRDPPDGEDRNSGQRPRRACRSSPATACWWRRRPDRPPTIFPRAGRSCRSRRRCSR